MGQIYGGFGASIASHGAWGPALFVVGYAIASAAFVPAGPLTIVAGVLFGLVAGTVYSFLGATLGACLAFTLSRRLGRTTIEARIARSPRLTAISRAVGADGRRVVMLLRLSPVIPFSAINVVMGVSPIRFADFAIACVAMLPVTVLYVYYGTVAGTLARAAVEHTHRGAAYYVLLGVGLIATIVVTTIVARAAKRSLAEVVR
ncbi:MAG: TVP38/TMEM64 family protein [Gemmatimonadales bacterium]